MKMAELFPLNCALIHLNPIALRKAKFVYNFGLSECNRVNVYSSHSMIKDTLLRIHCIAKRCLDTNEFAHNVILYGLYQLINTAFVRKILKSK